MPNTLSYSSSAALGNYTDCCIFPERVTKPMAERYITTYSTDADVETVDLNCPLLLQGNEGAKISLCLQTLKH